MDERRARGAVIGRFQREKSTLIFCMCFIKTKYLDLLIRAVQRTDVTKTQTPSNAPSPANTLSTTRQGKRTQGNTYFVNIRVQLAECEQAK